MELEMEQLKFKEFSAQYGEPVSDMVVNPNTRLSLFLCVVLCHISIKEYVAVLSLCAPDTSL